MSMWQAYAERPVWLDNVLTILSNGLKGGGKGAAATGAKPVPIAIKTFTAVYAGDLKDGKQHGKGKETYTDGTKYDGSYSDGQRHGKG